MRLTALAVLLLVVVLDTASAQNCTANDYVGVYTECNYHNFTRMVVYYWKVNCTVADVPLPPPVFNLPCNVSCPAGNYLPVGSTTCSPCTNGTYSLGGGYSYAHWDETKGWPYGFETSCESENCTGWEIGGPTFIDSGDNSNAHNATSTLLLTAVYLRDGYISFSYRVDSEHYFDYMMFSIDDIVKIERASAVPEWTNFYLSVSAGTHIFKWKYVKDYSLSAGQDRAYLEQIDLVGTRFAESSCHSCPPGKFSQAGASACHACERNTYAIGGNATCDPCPETFWSPPGSASCMKMPACTDEHFGRVTTQCHNNQRTYYYNYLDPVLCDLTNPASKVPNTTHVTEACPACPPGYKNDDYCTPCPSGTILGPSGTCVQCGGGFAAIKSAIYKFDRNNETSKLPAEITTSCIGDCGVDGWRLRNGYVDTGGEHGTQIELVLAWNGDLEGHVEGLYRPELEEPNINNVYMISFDAAVDCQDIIATHCGLQVYANNESLVQISGSSPLFKHFEYTLSRGVIRHGRYLNDSTRVHLLLQFIFQMSDSKVELSETSAKVTNIVIHTTKDIGSASSCATCLAGSHSVPENHTCVLCPAGTSSPQAASTCSACVNNTYTAKHGESQCLACGPGTTAWANATGCDINNCHFRHPDIPFLEYDLSPLGRTTDMWGPVYDILNMEYYFNPCSTVHSNHSCYDIDGNPISTYACQITNHGYGLDIGSTLGFLPHPTTPDHGLIMTLEHGAPGCSPNHPRATNITFICDASKGAGFPEAPSAPIENPPASCYYDLEWRSVYACPLCTPSHYHAILGECNFNTNMREVLYVWNTEPKDCHGGVTLPVSTTAPCVGNITCPAGSYAAGVNGTECLPAPPGTYSPGGGDRYDGFGMANKFPPHFSYRCHPTDYCTSWAARDQVLVSGFNYTESYMSTIVTLVVPGSISFTYQTFGSTYNPRPGPSFLKPGFSVMVSSINTTWYVDDIFDTEQVGTIQLPNGTHTVVFRHAPGVQDAHPMRIRDITVMGTRTATIDPIPCSPGSYSHGNATHCTLCPANTVAHNSRSTECTPCDEGAYEYSFPGEDECRTRRQCTYNDVTFKHGPCTLVEGQYKMLETASFVNPHICYPPANFILPQPVNISCTTNDIKPPAGMFVTNGAYRPCVSGYARNKDEATCTQCKEYTAAVPVLVFDDFSYTNVFPSYGNWTTRCSGPHAQGFGWTSGTTDPRLRAPLFSGYYPGEEIDCIATLNVVPAANYTEDIVVDFTYRIDADANATNLMMFGLYIYADKTPVWSQRTTSNDIQHATIRLSANAHAIDFDFFQTHKYEVNDEAAVGAYITIYSVQVTGAQGGGATQCVQCQGGLEAPVAGMSVCNACGKGYYSPMSNASLCSACPATSFAEFEKSERCTQCGHGTSNPPGHAYTDCSFSHCSLYPWDARVGYDLSRLMSNTEREVRIDDTTSAWLSLCSRNHEKHCKSTTSYNPFICLERRGMPGFTDIGRIISFEERVPDATSFDVRMIGGKDNAASSITFVCDPSAGINGVLTFNKHNTSMNIYEFTWRTEIACSPCREDQVTTTKSSCVNGKRIVDKVPNNGTMCSRPAQTTESCTVTPTENGGVSGWTVAGLVSGFCIAGAAGFIYMNNKHKTLNNRYAQLLNSGKRASGFDARLIEEDHEAQEVPTTTDSGDYSNPTTTQV